LVSRLAFVLLVARFVLGCAAAQPASGPGQPGPAAQQVSAPGQVASGPGQSGATLGDVARRPQAFVGQTVDVQGWLVSTQTTASGTIVDVAVSEEALRRAQAGQAGPDDRVAWLLPAGHDSAPLDAIRGAELRLIGRVEETTTTADGRALLRISPIQLLTRTPTHLESSPIGPGERAIFFGDPRLPSSRAEPMVRFMFLRPELPRPLWYLPGTVTIEHTGSADAPRYTFRSEVRREDGGATRESSCGFVAENGNLRSVSYDETVFDAAGKLGEQQHLDFATGKFFDKASGREFPWPQNIYAGPCLGFALSGFPFADRRAVDFYLWNEFDAATPMWAVVDGTESVSVPAGVFDCYRVRMNANQRQILRDLALPTEQAADIARSIIADARQPDSLLWMTTAWPHIVVKTEGLVGSPGTSPAVMEVVKLDRPTRAVLAENRTAPP